MISQINAVLQKLDDVFQENRGELKLRIIIISTGVYEAYKNITPSAELYFMLIVLDSVHVLRGIVFYVVVCVWQIPDQMDC